MSANPVAECFSANLRRARERRELSQEAVAALTGLHRTEISLLERAGREPRLGTLLKLAAALDTPLAALADGIAWEPAAGERRVPPSPAPGRFRLVLDDDQP